MAPRSKLTEDPRLLFTLLAATVVSLATTVVGGYQTRLAILDGSAWVTHTSEVKLALFAAQLHLDELAVDRGDARTVDALRDSESTVRTLTSDNARQQVRIGRSFEMTERLVAAAPQAGTPAWAATAGDLRALLFEMITEEDRLMIVRAAVLDEGRRRSSSAFAAGATLTCVLGLLAILALRTQRNRLARAQSELHKQRAMLESIVNSVAEGVLAMTPTKDLLVVNDAARSILGHSFPTDRLDEDWRSRIVATYEDGSRMLPENGPLARAVRGESIRELVYHIKAAEDPGEGKWVSATSRPILDENGELAAGVITLRDITDQRRHADELRATSLRDELTHLYNRRGFATLAEQHMRVAARGKVPFGVMYADLNGLKQINDELGHERGDEAIVTASRVFVETFRAPDIVARLGGDEFAMLLADANPARGEAIVHRLNAAIRARNAEGGKGARISLSVGLAYYDPSQPKPMEDLLAEADRRMYEQKRARKEKPGGDK